MYVGDQEQFRVTREYGTMFMGYNDGSEIMRVIETGTSSPKLLAPTGKSMYIYAGDNLHVNARDAVWFEPGEGAGTSGGDIRIYDYRGGTNYVNFDGSTQRVGIGTAAPNVELHVNGDGRFEEDHKLYFSDSATNVFIRGASSDLELHSADDIFLNADDDIRIASDQVTFADDGDNVHLNYYGNWY